MAVDNEGVLHILELKRDKTPRDVVAQLLDYGSWASSLTHENVLDIWRDYARSNGVAFEEAFEDRFGTSPPDDLNTAHRLTIVASELDTSTERIVTYLAARYAVPINALFFSYFEDGGNRYVARTWLLDQAVTKAGAGSRSTPRTKEPWNGADWYVSFGADVERSWEDAVKYGFVSGGGGAWYSNTLRKLPVGARAFVYIPKSGYVGVGEVTGEAAPFPDAMVSVDGAEQRLADQSLTGTYTHAGGEEWVVPIRWIKTVPQAEAISHKGLYANQNTATKLRSQFTLSTLIDAFGLED